MHATFILAAKIQSFPCKMGGIHGYAFWQQALTVRRFCITVYDVDIQETART